MKYFEGNSHVLAFKATMYGWQIKGVVSFFVQVLAVPSPVGRFLGGKEVH